MIKTVVGVFSSSKQAEEAISNLRNMGFDKEISMVAKDANKQQSSAGEQQNGNEGFSMVNNNNTNITNGITTGGIVGGLAGLAMGAGALLVPGFGPLIAAGPIAGLISGAATGGIAGGLIDWGIPEQASREYENEVRQGKILVSVQASSPKADQAADVLKSYNADNVRIHDKQ
ncbi:MAG: hypothetical protein ACOX5W_12625 [Bacillota bacterium]|jgi:uncharacterized membrane protein